MEQTKCVQQWLERFLKQDTGGYVLVGRQDGIPGSCCLTYLGDRLLDRQVSLTGRTITEHRCHFHLTRVCNEPEPYGWLHRLESWAQRNNEEEDTVLYFGSEPVKVTLENGRVEQLQPEGSCVVGVDIFGDYTRVPASWVQPLEPLFTLDGESYEVDVLELRREFTVESHLPGCTTLDGTLHREPLGTYCHYRLTIGGRSDPGELNRLWQKLSQPAESILCSFPGSDGMLTQRMFVEKGSQKLRQPGCWDELTIRFLALAPEVTV